MRRPPNGNRAPSLRRPLLDTPEFRTIAASFPWTADARGAGDDAAIVGARGLLCCDALCEGVHFRRDWSSLTDVGWKSVAQNVADIFAMGGVPTEAVWSVGLGADWDSRAFAQLARGASAACERYGCRIVGGDTVRTGGPGFVSLALRGTLTGRPWLRSGAKAGDNLLLAGSLGLSAAGLDLLRSGLPAGSPSRPVSVHRRPVPPGECAALLRAAGRAVHAAIDISDGLSSEAHHLALSSGLSLEIDLEALPLSPSLVRAARLLGTGTEAWLLHGGEEHALLVAAAPGLALPEGTRVVGRFAEGSGVVVVGRDGRREALAPGGWVHR